VIDGGNASRAWPIDKPNEAAEERRLPGDLVIQSGQISENGIRDGDVARRWL